MAGEGDQPRPGGVHDDVAGLGKAGGGLASAGWAGGQLSCAQCANICANISAQDAHVGVWMHGNVRIPAARMRRLRTSVFLMDTLQAGGHRFEPGTLHSVKPAQTTE